ncbi:hypothetical protein EGJ53_24735 [Pseudomonas fluorescens]|nr:hypothetical protein EGJ53_24735 [Pseudomonas fluorescens]
MVRVPMIVPTLRVGMPPRTLRVRFGWDAERPWLRSHAERGNDQSKRLIFSDLPHPAMAHHPAAAPCHG